MLLSGKLPAGPNSITWNGLDQTRKQVPAGVYFARLEFAGQTRTRKMLYMN